MNQLFFICFTIFAIFILPINGDIYHDFSTFCNNNFGAEKDSLVYKTFGNGVEILEEDSWQYVSKQSVCIVKKTNLPSKSFIKYWIANTSDTLLSDTTDRYYYTHTHYLKNLEEGNTYSYKLSFLDERGNTTVTSISSFTLITDSNIIEIPGQLGEPPYFLDQPEATYLLTNNIIANGTAINIMSSDITVDLGGNTIFYNNQADAIDSGAVEGDFGHYGIIGTHGIRSKYGLRNCRIFNGIISQGSGNGGNGFQPIYQASGIDEIAGVTVIYYGSQLSGVNSAPLIHHSTFIDTGTEITNRHQGIDAIQGADSIYHNLIKRVRHRGISINDNASIENNEIYIDSWATNSYGIFAYAKNNATIQNNKIFGTGYHAIGIGAVSSGVRDIDVHNNFIHMQATAPVDRSSEYGPQSSVNGIRVTWGGENLNFNNNILISNAIDSGLARGVWFCPNDEQQNIVFQNNTIKAVANNLSSNKFGAIVISGEDSPNVNSVNFINNDIFSNFCNILLGEPYGYGNNTIFNNNLFVKLGDLDNYRTIQCGYWDKDNSGNTFINSTFEGGASYEKILWSGTSGEREYTVKWSLYTSAPAGATIEIVNSLGNTLSVNTVNNQQFIKEDLAQYTHTADSLYNYTPHTVHAFYNGDTQTVSILMDTIKVINFFGIELSNKEDNLKVKTKIEFFKLNGRKLIFKNFNNDITIQLFQLNGKRVMKEKISPKGKDNFLKIPKNIHSGIYVVNLKFSQKNISSKIIIK